MAQETQHAVVRPYSIFAGILSYLVPGLGQISQGRTGKGVLFMVCLLSLFHVGEAMGNWQNVYIPTDDNPNGPRNPLRNIFNQRWHFAGQLWIGVAAWPAIWQYYGGPMPSRETSPFLHNYQKQPIEGRIEDRGTVNEFLVNSDKTPDLGWIYTVIAGMLNVLVIYDAYAGPAYGPKIPREVKDNQPATEAAPS
jgi:hypothetical protein